MRLIIRPRLRLHKGGGFGKVAAYSIFDTVSLAPPALWPTAYEFCPLVIRATLSTSVYKTDHRTTAPAPADWTAAPEAA